MQPGVSFQRCGTCLDTYRGRTRVFLWKSARHRLASAGVRGRPAKIKIRAPERRRGSHRPPTRVAPTQKAARRRQELPTRSCPPAHHKSEAD